MKMALNAKNKLVFVNGNLSKPTSYIADIQLWERCSDMVLSWILNSIDKSIVSSLIYHAYPRDVWLDLEDRFSQSNNPRIFKLKCDIVTLTQGSMTISAYFTTLKSHWDELAMLTPTPQCTCGILTELNHMQDTERVFQFLMGLHDSYASIRSQVLAMDPLPPVNNVYSTLHQEEKQHLLHIPSFPTESAAMMAPRHLSHRFDSKGRGRGRPKCDYCDRDGHWRTHCYKLNGYPSNRPQPRGTFDRTSGSSKAANNVIGSSTPAGSSKTENVVTGSSTSTEIAIPGLTSDQYNRLLEFLSPVNTNSANFAGNSVSCNSVFFSNREWIIDSGASDHMTSSFSSLDNTQLLNQPCPISLPNGDIVSITHTGTLRISPEISLPNVLYVPSFKFNLLSISKLTSTLNCVAIFFF
jgi:hypothetical protein